MSHEFGNPIQPSPYELALEISDDHFAEARQLAASDTFDHNHAEYVLRCPAVFTDRLKPEEFEQLDLNLQNGFRNLAISVRGHLETEPEDNLEPHPTETASQHNYRVNVWSVMHRLQSLVLVGPRPERGGYEPEKESMVREAVFLASDLFHRALPEAVELGFPGVIETLGYFRNKTSRQKNSA